ncbi:hypothetical protein RND81_02G190300 [Saponaria officinalis]|uniref:Leucine-rich repeat-containing N-terminal plant-type domain-containing protein n=1 Tax=Saponaria officinalis TaxID=3572 RepID=A0AAW1MW06_SAPOF
MSPKFHTNVHNHLLVLLFYAWLTFCNSNGRSSEVTKIGIQCVESERTVLLKFKQGILVDNCGLLDSWGDGFNCCQWRGVHCSNYSGHVISLRLSAIQGSDYDNYTGCLEGTISDSLLELTGLKYLDLSLNHFQRQFPKFIGSFANLEYLNLSNAGFMGIVPQEIENLSRLLSLDLNCRLYFGGSKMRVESLSWLSRLGLLKRLDLRLDTSLVYLDLSGNKIFRNNIQMSRRAMKFLGTLCNLQTLHLVDTNLNSDFSSIVQSFSLCPQKALTSLDLSANQIWGSISDNINTFSLSLNSNSLKEVFTDDHLSNLSKLSRLDLGYNTELAVHVSAKWIPSFQLDYLSLDSRKVGPDFPLWLTTQKYLTFIGLSNASISATIPVSFFNSLSSKLEYLSMPRNMMHGGLRDVSITFDFPPQIDLSSNNFHGAIPSFLRNVSELYLNKNHISHGLVPFLCQHNKTSLVSLDLSHNVIFDKLPDCWGYFDQLQMLCARKRFWSLHLENNKIWGSLPTSIGMLEKLNVLHISNNNVSGELPSSLVNCKSLVILDLSHNSMTGYIPSTFWDSFKDLSNLTLKSNNFIGALPSSFCQLSRIQILDLSSNVINGTIPRCIYNFKGMANTTNVLASIIFDVSPRIMKDSYDSALITWKRKELFFQGYSSVGLAKTLDFSNNKLEGDIPEGISSLIGLVSINLSRNHLSGGITSKIGQLTSLDVLDLSHNNLLGEIPTSLVTITTLDVLDLSYNNLSGKIPTGTQLQNFDDSAYMENPRLCGAPLPECEGDGGAATITQNGGNASPQNEHHLDDFMLGLYISVVVGLITGFWGVCGALVLKTSWRQAFFRFCDDLKDRIYVIVVVHSARVWRRS